MLTFDCSTWPYDCFLTTKCCITTALDELVKGNTEEVRLIHIVSSEFLDMFGLDTPEDFNGWCCDWFTTMDYKGTKINIDGCAWYGTINLYLEE